MKKYFLILLVAVTTLLCALFAPAQTVNVLIFAALIAAITWFVSDTTRGFRRSRLVMAINSLPASVGSSRQTRRYRATAPIGTKLLFVKQGADDIHVAVIAAASDKPLGVAVDEAENAEDGVTVELCGINGRTLPCVASAAINALNGDAYSDGTGKVMIKPTAAGSYWKVGRFNTTSQAANDPIEVTLCEPRKLIVVSALQSTDGTAAAAADNTALRAEVEKLGDDLRKIAAALDGSADVALATT